MNSFWRFLGGVGLLLVGVGAGWELRGYKDGTITTSSKATKQANAAVQREVKADREISNAANVAATAAKSLEDELRTGSIDHNCTPGSGAVSGPVVDSLRLEFSKKE